MPEGRDQYYINPYVGCMIGCEFCYVAQRADLSWGMQGLAEMPWGHRLDVKVNAPEVLARELRGRRPPALGRVRARGDEIALAHDPSSASLRW